MKTPDPENPETPTGEDAVLSCAELPEGALHQLLSPLGLQLHAVPTGAEIPGSYWGEREAGLIGKGLYLRPDTPVHSALHEACHWLLADDARRAAMHTNAGGTDSEEHAVCYLQCLLAARLAGYSQARCLQDMDAWGYTFISGKAALWFAGDSQPEQQYLQARGWL